MSLEFRLDGSDRSLELGESISSIPHKIYRDAPADIVSALVERVKKGSPWRNLIESEVTSRNQWLAKIILNEKRNDFLKLVPEFESDFFALDVGAGWGQHTIDISHQGRVCSIEPSPERFDFMKAICEQEGSNGNCYFLNCSLGQIEFQSEFDFALCIGVLEWVGKFEECDNPRIAQLNFLRKIKESLNHGAPLIVGIENRLGLKYLLGSNDDHVGVSHVACMEYEDAKRAWYGMKGEVLKVATYSKAEYDALFKEAGFTDLVYYSAMPDYKIPERIVECYPNDRLSEYLIERKHLKEHDGSNGRSCEMDELLESMYATLAKEGVAPLFSPSYFIVAR